MARPPRTIALAVALAALVALAWWQRNVVDDAFIMLRYAAHLVAGDGLVWNRGERVEGYTNFLGTLGFAAGLAMGFDPVTFSHVFNLIFFVIALVLFWILARRVLESDGHALAATLLLGANFSFNTAGTQGLGTHMQTAALLGCMTLLVRVRDAPASWHTWAFSVVAAISVLVRMDSLLPAGLLGAAALVFVARPADAPGIAWRRVAALVLPGAAIVGAWLCWRWRYYGDLLPNTFYVKVSSVGATLAGLHYLYLFVLSYLLVPHLVVLVAGLRRLRLPADWVVALSCTIVVAWCAYVVRIGGDFIEFRFLVPVLPFLVLSIYWSVLRVVSDRTLRVALLALLAVGSVHHQLAFGRTVATGPINRPSLAVVTERDAAARLPILWSEKETGLYLGRIFGHDPAVRIAIGAAGVIPFYSRLGFVDIMGLNDHWVARNGTPLRFGRFVGGLWPAHVRIATLDYLLRSQVHLFVGAGSLTRDDVAASLQTLPDLLTAMLAGEPDIARAFSIRPGELPPDAMVVEIPVRPGYQLLALYLTRSPRVDAIIAAEGWRTYPARTLAGA